MLPGIPSHKSFMNLLRTLQGIFLIRRCRTHFTHPPHICPEGSKRKHTMDLNRDFKNPETCKPLLDKLTHLLDGRQMRFMEVCGTHTVSIFHSGLRALLPSNIHHLSGPGCPVCVTHDAEIAAFLNLASQDNVIIATFGDVLRVPGPKGISLKHAQAQGARIEVVYSPLDAISLAQKNPQDTVVFLGIGFETTAPTVAGTVLMAEQQGIQNLCVFSCHKLVPPALQALLDDTQSRIDAFLLPGHVSTILGMEPYQFLKERNVPGIVAGFDIGDILLALCMMAEQIQENKADVCNAYLRAVDNAGNPRARAILEQVFTPSAALWRGMGTIPHSGLAMADAYAHFDAFKRFHITLPETTIPSGCRCGDVLKGVISPPQCPLFAKSCTPAKPVGPCMVSTEGSCAAYHKYNLEA